MITVKEKVLNALLDLPQNVEFEGILERIYSLYKVEIGLPNKADQDIASVAQKAMNDYLNDPELTAFTVLDGEDFYHESDRA